MSGGWGLDEETRSVLRAYAARRISRGAAAEHLRVSEVTVTDWMHRLGMHRGPAPVAGPRCADCGEPCAYAAQRCRRCHEARQVRPRPGTICPQCGGPKTDQRARVCWSCDMPRRRRHWKEVGRQRYLTGR